MVAAAAVLTLLPAVASAHVRVVADSTAAGSFSQLTFRVPNESDRAATVSLEVRLPTDQPLLYVSTKPVPGWTAKTVETKLPKPVESYGTTITKAISRVTWTADGAGSAIRPGEYQEFSISAGPLPAAGQLVLPAVQTYSDGTVVAWDEPPAASGEEPEHPAPVLTVTTAAAPGATPSASAEPAAQSTTEPAPAAAGSDWVARGLGGAGLVVGGVGAVLAGLALRRVSGRSSG